MTLADKIAKANAEHRGGYSAADFEMLAERGFDIYLVLTDGGKIAPHIVGEFNEDWECKSCNKLVSDPIHSGAAKAYAAALARDDDAT